MVQNTLNKIYGGFKANKPKLPVTCRVGDKLEFLVTMYLCVPFYCRVKEKKNVRFLTDVEKKK